MAGRFTSVLAKVAAGTMLAVVLFVAAFALLEGALRIAGKGHDTQFWRKETDASGKTWIRENHFVTAPYFSPGLMRWPQGFRLPEKKGPRSYRIFLLGSSAAMGDPEASFGMARVLQTLLRAAYPDIEFEVVNAGITAINSHVVVRIAEDCAKLQPDAFIVYEGNNEVIGPYGPATVFSPFLRTASAIDLSIWFRSLRVGQWLQALGSSSDAPKGWGGMEMFLQHEIRADDPRLEQTQAAFQRNLERIADAGIHAGAKVWLSTVLTNQRDFAPFLSRSSPNLSLDAAASWKREYDLLLAELRAQHYEEAEKAGLQAAERDPGHAETFFQLGRAQLALGKVDVARVSLQKALDLDTLRFRTDSKLNETIRRVARTHGGGVALVDAEQVIASAMPDGLLGNQQLYEHVHLTSQGNYAVAVQFFRAISKDLVSRKWISREGGEIAPEEVRKRLAITPYEQVLIMKELLARFSRPPFTGQSSNAERVAELAQRERIALQRLDTPGLREALFQWYDDAMRLAPDDWVLARNAGTAMVALGQPARGLPHLQRAREIIPDDPDTLYGLALAQKALNDPAAVDTARTLRQLEPRYPGLDALGVR